MGVAVLGLVWDGKQASQPPVELLCTLLNMEGEERLGFLFVLSLLFWIIFMNNVRFRQVDKNALFDMLTQSVVPKEPSQTSILIKLKVLAPGYSDFPCVMLKKQQDKARWAFFFEEVKEWKSYFFLHLSGLAIQRENKGSCLYLCESDIFYSHKKRERSHLCQPPVWFLDVFFLGG